MDKCPEKPTPKPKPTHLKRTGPSVAPYNGAPSTATNTTRYTNVEPLPPLPPRTILREPPNGTPFHTYIDANAKNLPVIVNIDTGLYGNMGNSSLYQEQLTLHFEMRLRIIRGKVDHGATFDIPFCSNLHVSLFHNPTDNLQQAMLGHYFETVGHILAKPSRSRPTAVCVTRSFSGPTAEASIAEGDILLVSPRVHTRTFKPGKFIKCVVVRTGDIKMLHENTVGGFTTQPDLLKLSLRDIWGHKYCVPPLKVVLYHNLPQIVLPQPIIMTLINEQWEDSVIATHQPSGIDNPSSADDEVYDNYNHTLRILKDIGITITTVQEEEVDGSLQQLHQGTYQFYNDFNLSFINQHLFPDDPVWPNFEEVQSMLYKNVYTDMTQDYTLKRPDSAFKTIKRNKSVKNYSPVVTRKGLGSTLSINETSNYTPVSMQRKPSIAETEVYATVTASATDDHERFPVVHDGAEVIPDVARLLHEVNTANRQMMIHVEGIRAEMEGLKQDLRQTKNIVGSMKRELYDMIGQLDSEVLYLRENMGDYVAVVKPTNTTPQSVETENKEILKSFSSDQVLQALDLLSMSRYRETFASKRITGLELVQYNDSILKDDLAIASQSDRIRLMLFIDGREAVWKLLESKSVR